MAHILKTEEFLMESSGAKLIDRTPDRFNSDPLADKEGSMLEKQMEKNKKVIEDYIDSELFMDSKYTNIFGNELDDGNRFVEIEAVDYYDTPTVKLNIDINWMLDLFCNNLNDSQKNALKHIGIDTGHSVSYKNNFGNFAKWLGSHIKEAWGSFYSPSQHTYGVSYGDEQYFGFKIEPCEQGYTIYIFYTHYFEENYQSVSKFLNTVKSTYLNIVDDILSVFEKEIFERILNKKME